MKKIALLLAIFAFGLQSVMAQTNEITGTVTSAEDGQSIPGVSVSVKGTTLGTITNIDGEYVLKVPENAATLVFSFVGMQTQEVAISGTVVNVQMEADVVGINEVVVTAMGIRRETKALGYAVQNVDSEELTKTGTSDLAKALQGKVAGIDIKVSSGMPGASSQIVIRGSRSFTGNNTPLYVIDGMPISSTASYSTGNSVTGADITNRALDINPNDIESINVLKGQAAAALYGLRASNGVVIITTKSGKGGPAGVPVVTVNQTTSFEQVSRTPDYQTTWAQGYSGSFNPRTSMSWGPKITDLPNDPTYGGNGNGHEGMYKVPQLEDAGLEPWVTPQVYNNWDDYYQTGITSTTGINVSQSNEGSSFSLGLGYTDQTGIALNTGMERWNGKATAERNLNDNFTVGFNANYAKTVVDKLTGANDGSLAGVLSAPSSYNLKGIPYHVPGDPYKQIYYRSLTFDNPYWIEKNNTFNEETNRFFGNGFLQYEAALTATMNLTVKYQLGVDSYTTHFQDIFGYGRKGGSGEINNYGVSSMTYNSLLTANYDWQINDDLDLNVILGNELDHNKRKAYDEYGQEFNFGGWNHISNANTVTADEDQEEKRTVGFFSSLSLSWKDMLFLNATGRNDFASSMPRDNRSFFYPSVSLGFVVSELDALKESSWLNFFKVRGSYAEVGQAGDYLENYFTKPSYSGGFWTGEPISYPLDGVNSYIPNNILYDPALKPQNTKSYELGINLKMFNNRLGIDYTYSKQNVEDQIFQVPLAGSTGAASLVMNGGKLHTDGHEVVLYATPIVLKDFSWDISVNFSKFTNVVDELAPGVESIFLGGFVTPQVRAGIGSTYPVIYGTQYKRDDQGRILVDEDPNSASYGMPMAGEPGVLGEVSPDFILGGSSTFTYKNISLSGVFEWKNGGKMYSGSNGLLDLYGMSARTEDRESTFIIDGYKSDGTPNDIVRGGASDPQAVQTLFSDVLSNIDEYYIHGNSFIKLRELSLKYYLPKGTINGVDIALSGFARNILLWTELDNFDPESSQGNNNMAGGFERFTLPQATSFGFGVEVKF
ncbi:SusC/RagA family TonB-linked outer membrane protein [Sunxiuqinia elliptica]|uniref:TonB-linked SusC/RagA family outer membrane protein n=1 Tax=Sunxiuqinia elliptica TaxID=655355 RepID=A0A4V3BYG7_9BACT|nr:SusC/RagA family TonB-linked outer membrane protein [Sunxiuqinia elliptica]TDO02619.1 TonB-linked SusC/RagA family outer membrane protein [Sunxiuqinia elliptica]TDO58643.1 TonB-linked SusC/RagA family outer membrane protein [Sunxiuqinia elliptica]